MADEKRIVVETNNLTKIYGDGDGVRALDGVSFTIHAGEFVAVMGPSGSGKSTLLNILGALDRPTSGVCKVNDQDLAKVKDLDRFRSKTVGFVFQLHNLIPTLTALENVEVPLQEENMSNAARRKRAEELLNLVSLGDRLHFMPAQLSGGQRQRVAIARALLKDPRILILDDATSSVDTETEQLIQKALERLMRGRTSFIIAQRLSTLRMADMILVLEKGRIAVRGTHEELLRTSGLYAEIYHQQMRGEDER